MYTGCKPPHTSYNMITPLIHKRIEFSHENEFRLIEQIPDAIDDEKYWNVNTNQKGKFINIDLNTLVENIYLPPTIDDKSKHRIIVLSERHGYKFNFIESILSSQPNY